MTPPSPDPAALADPVLEEGAQLHQAFAGNLDFKGIAKYCTIEQSRKWAIAEPTSARALVAKSRALSGYDEGVAAMREAAAVAAQLEMDAWRVGGPEFGSEIYGAKCVRDAIRALPTPPNPVPEHIDRNRVRDLITDLMDPNDGWIDAQAIWFADQVIDAILPYLRLSPIPDRIATLEAHAARLEAAVEKERGRVRDLEETLKTTRNYVFDGTHIAELIDAALQGTGL